MHIELFTWGAALVEFFFVRCSEPGWQHRPCLKSLEHELQFLGEIVVDRVSSPQSAWDYRFVLRSRRFLFSFHG